MKLISLTLDNFKGIRHFELKPDGHSVIVKAANGAGKTTLQDAYWWLLTGKNADQSADFDIYPYDAPAGVEASVTGVFRLDDNTEFSLRRTYKQRIERRRGDAEATVRGNKTEFFINEIPKAQKDFLPFISEHFGGDRLLMLSKLHYFPLDMNWSDRRQILIDLFAPHLSDSDIIKAHNELEPLSGYIGCMTTVADYAQQAKAQRKAFENRRKEIPARIDEANNSKPDLPADADPAAIPRLAKRKIKLQNTIAALTNGENAAAIRKRIAEQEAKAAEARAAYIKETAGGNENLQRQAAALREQIQTTETKRAKALLEKDNCESFTASLEPEIAELREKARTVHYSEFDSSKTICPTCGQIYPQERIDEIRAEFNMNKVSEEESIRKKGTELKNLLMLYKDRTAKVTEEIQSCDQRLTMLKDHLRAVTKMIVTPPAWETTTDAKAYSVELCKLREQLDQIDALTAKQLEDTRAELAAVETQISKITSRTAIDEQREKIDARIHALMDEEKKLGIELAKLDQRLQLTERFVQLQAADIEDKINAAFTDVKWILFDRQVNGGIAPCCRAMLKNRKGLYVDYSHNANTANTYNGGLHIIDGLSKVIGLQLPVWIDQAESCTNYTQINNQVIRLQVSAEHPEITVEVLA